MNDTLLSTLQTDESHTRQSRNTTNDMEMNHGQGQGGRDDQLLLSLFFLVDGQNWESFHLSFWHPNWFYRYQEEIIRRVRCFILRKRMKRRILQTDIKTRDHYCSHFSLVFSVSYIVRHLLVHNLSCFSYFLFLVWTRVDFKHMPPKWRSKIRESRVGQSWWRIRFCIPRALFRSWFMILTALIGRWNNLFLAFWWWHTYIVLSDREIH